MWAGTPISWMMAVTMLSSCGAGSRSCGGATARRICSIRELSLTGLGRKIYAPMLTASATIRSL